LVTARHNYFLFNEIIPARNKKSVDRSSRTFREKLTKLFVPFVVVQSFPPGISSCHLRVWRICFGALFFLFYSIRRFTYFSPLF
jgi:hypothetical protein